MRSLKDIFYNVKAEREILFEDGEWCIYRRVDHSPVSTSRPVANGCYIIHRCEKVQKALNRDTWVCGNKREHGCGETAPEGLQGLYILHGWDR